MNALSSRGADAKTRTFLTLSTFISYKMDDITPSGQLGDTLRNMSLGSQLPCATQDRPPVPLFAEAGAPGATQENLGTQDFVTPVCGPSCWAAAVCSRSSTWCPAWNPFASASSTRLTSSNLNTIRATRTHDISARPRTYHPIASSGRARRARVSLRPATITSALAMWLTHALPSDANIVDGNSQDLSRQGLNPPGPSRTVISNPYAQTRRFLLRPQSPPCFRSVFDSNTGEGQLVNVVTSRAASAAAAQQQQCVSRFHQDFKETGLLGQGSFSKVYRARHRLDGREYAVKRSICEVAHGSPQFAQFVQEVQALAVLPPHPHVVQYYTAWRELGERGGAHLYIQLECCEASLAAHASLGDPLRQPELLELLRQMASALAHLHAHGVAHMDIKPENIYVRHNEGGAPIFKLGDFGQATSVDGSGPAHVSEGDSRYLPHEVLNGFYSRLDKADMFSLGITLYELASGAVGNMPSGGPQYQELRAGNIGLLPAISITLQNLIK